MRFAHLPGGGNVYAAKLLPALVRLRDDVCWRIYHNPPSEPQQRILDEIAELVPAERLELRPIRSGCLTLRQHWEFARVRDDADVFHYLHFDMPLGLHGPPLVITIHDLYPITVPNYCGALKRKYFRMLTGRNVRRAQQVIAISQHTRDEIVEHFQVDPAKITVVGQSHSAAYRPVEDERTLAAASERYNLPEVFVFYTGNHKPHKNLPRLIEAYAQLPAALREAFPLLLTGRVGNDAQALLAQAERLGIAASVRFLGWVAEEDLPALYTRAALVVQPSLCEGFGLAPLEAMACGTAVVCANTTATPEVVGEAGRTFDPTDVEEMAAQIAAALEHDVDCASRREAALARAALFSEEATAKATFAVYEKAGG